uniref:TPT domain-containing protein n=1 Tax=Meloidogyne hapla TaxID=6305 RepID=A0A1I8BYQ6_MELHA
MSSLAFLTLFTCSLNTIAVETLSNSYLLITIIFFVVSLANNWVIGLGVPFPLIIVSRSGTLVANVILTCLLQNRWYSINRIASVLAVTCGIIFFTLSSQTNSFVEENDFGMPILVLELLLELQGRCWRWKMRLINWKSCCRCCTCFVHLLPLLYMLRALVAAAVHASCTCRDSLLHQHIALPYARRETDWQCHAPEEQTRRLKGQPITEEMKNFKVYSHLRRVRDAAQMKGKRDKKAKKATN